MERGGGENNSIWAVFFFFPITLDHEKYESKKNYGALPFLICFRCKVCDMRNIYIEGGNLFLSLSINTVTHTPPCIG